MLKQVEKILNESLSVKNEILEDSKIKNMIIESVNVIL